MTAVPAATERRLGLVIDLDTCVGCHACAVSCKEWNTGGYPAPLSDESPYAAGQRGSWLNRVHAYEVTPGETVGGGENGGSVAGRTVYFPKSCLHCDDPPCVTVCPTGASYKREADGIVLVDEALCIGCELCSWACPYGAREYDAPTGVMKKCTLCIDRIYNESLPEAEREPACVAACPARARHFGDFSDPQSDVSRLVRERGGIDLMPELECRPTNKYLPPRPPVSVEAPPALPDAPAAGGFLGWLDCLLSQTSD